ncbi:ROK family protein [Amnibacterium kyonggiense]|uniref:Putative NBD/HSP70 family sugar kinase n=1 Tax=Amnibacterium kyonggiense TaxID=595671 RepID=A0A4R7FKE1_9MICO|nr:ROK family protein [Amnibacterium kyonggiense]TDS76816.1 putative NBD/HSP70 family sugar kinase [Amnibacterium kyonggiense]
MSGPVPSDSPQRARARNRRLVLDVVQYEGAITRAGLGAIINLSKTAIKEICDGLIADGLLEEFQPEVDQRRQGRPALSLRVARGNGALLGIDIGADKVVVRSATLAGDVLRTREMRTRREKPDRDYLLTLLERAVGQVRDVDESGDAAFHTVVVSTPGVVDPQTSVVTLAPQIVGWDGTDLREAVASRIGVPADRVFVERQTDLSVLAESVDGAARGVDDVLYVQLGIGIGGGLIVGGQLVPGAAGAAGELGYLPIDFGDRPPSGSGIGAWEWAAGGRAWARYGRAAAIEHHGARLRELAGGLAEDVDAETVFRAAREGDPAALDVVGLLSRRIGIGIAAAVCVLNPRVVLIAGGIAKGGALLLDAVRDEVAGAVPVLPEIRLAAYSADGCVVGAVHRATQLAFDTLNPVP